MAQVRTNVTPVNPADLRSVTLTEGQWLQVRAAVLNVACQFRIDGKDDAAHWYRTYRSLVNAMVD